MRNPMRNHHFWNFSRSSLPLQISFPFVLMFLGGWMLFGAIVGQRLSEQMERDQQEQAAELASLVNREIDRELFSLRRSARLLARDESIVEGVAQSSSDSIQREVLPLKSILGTDFVTIFNSDSQTLLDIRQLSVRELALNYRSVVDLTLAGADISTIVRPSEQSAPFVIGTAPIRNEQGMVGGIILGTALSDELLSQINESIREQIVVVDDDKVVASTFPIETDILSWIDSSEMGRQVMIDDESFLAQPIVLDGLAGDSFEVILLISRTPLLAAKQSLWVFIIGLASVGTLLTAVLGYWIARNIARPIQAITGVAVKVVEDGNFDLQSPIQTQDEIGLLSSSVNQLIQWVKEYTDELALSAQTLEERVEQRTEALSEALTELKDTQSQLIQTEKMSSLGQMVAGIAHEINNPISFVQGNISPLTHYFEDIVDLLETYQREYPEPVAAIADKQEDIEIDFLLQDVTKILGSMKMGTQRVRDIVVSLRNFSRLDESTIKDVDLCEGLDSTLLILNHRIKQGVKVTKHYETLPLVSCSPAQLNQVFTNIIANALDAMFDADVPTKELVVSARQCQGEQVQVSIRDTGPGMPAEVIDKIFDPFFTTKPVGKGTGLGLGICFKIIQQHQGTLVVNSDPGNGTEFVITLPKQPNFELSSEPSESVDSPSLLAAA
ncbi:MAG: ATP-binding protein [Phormidesmis sp.]